MLIENLRQLKDLNITYEELCDLSRIVSKEFEKLFINYIYIEPTSNIKTQTRLFKSGDIRYERNRGSIIIYLDLVQDKLPKTNAILESMITRSRNEYRFMRGKNALINDFHLLSNRLELLEGANTFMLMYALIESIEQGYTMEDIVFVNGVNPVKGYYKEDVSIGEENGTVYISTKRHPESEEIPIESLNYLLRMNEDDMQKLFTDCLISVKFSKKNLTIKKRGCTNDESFKCAVLSIKGEEKRKVK